MSAVVSHDATQSGRISPVWEKETAIEQIPAILASHRFLQGASKRQSENSCLQDEQSAYKAQWTGTGYYRRRKNDYLSFLCPNSQSPQGQQRQKIKNKRRNTI